MLKELPVASERLVSDEDALFFVEMCRNLRKYGKPVPFIPIVGKDFSFWFKKDSLWYSKTLLSSGAMQVACAFFKAVQRPAL